MRQSNELEATVKELQSIASSINAIALKLSAQEPADSPDKPEITLESVRAVLAEKSREGFTAEVRSLLQKYGADKLSAVDPASYEALLKDAEELGNG